MADAGRSIGVELDGEHYRLYTPPPKHAASQNESWDSATVNAPVQIKDQDVIQSDWSGGFGHARSGADVPKNTYAWGVNIYTRDRGMLSPSGLIEELSLPINVRSFDGTEVSRAPIAGRDWQNSSTSTNFFFTCGEYICIDMLGSGNVADVWYGGSGSSHGVQYVSCELFEDGNSNTALFFGVQTNGMTGPYNAIVKYDGSAATPVRKNLALADATATIGRMKVCHLEPGQGLASLVPSGADAGKGTDYLIGGFTGSVFTNPPNTLYACPRGSDPMVQGNWATWMKIGHNKYGIASLVGGRHHCYVVKPDGVFDFNDSGDVAPLTLWWNDVLDVNNGVASTFFDGGIMASHVTGIDWIDVANGTPRQDYPEDVTPGHHTGNETPINGRYTAFCPYNGVMFAACNVAGNTYIMAGVPGRMVNSAKRFVWHGAEAYIPGVSVTMLAVSNASGRPMLYIGGLDSADGKTPRLFRQYLPSHGSPIADLLYGDSGFKFNPTASLYNRVESWGYPGANKIIPAIDVMADGLGAGSYAEVYAATDLADVADDSSYLLQGSITSAPGETLFTDDGTGTDTTASGFLFGRHLASRIDLHGLTNTPVRVRSTTMTADVKVRTSAESTLTFELTPAMPAHELSIDRSDMQQAYAHLVSLQDGPEVTYVNRDRERFTVIVQSGSVALGQEKAADDINWVGVARVRVRFVDSVMYADIDSADGNKRAS